METQFTFTVELGHTELLEPAAITFAANGEIAVSEGDAIVPLHEERSTVGDTPHAARANFIEANPPRRFVREHLRSVPYSLQFGRLLRQFAAAHASDNRIDAYLNTFKVVETLYHRSKLKAREALEKSDEFRRLLRRSLRAIVDRKPQEPTDDDVTAMINRLVEVRANCAHLREHNALGYAPGDPEVTRRVEPLFEILSDTARAAIQERIDAKRQSEPPPIGA